MPESAEGQLIDQNYKVNYNRLYCMAADDLKSLIDVEAHDLWKTEEINELHKSRLSDLMQDSRNNQTPQFVKFLD